MVNEGDDQSSSKDDVREIASASDRNPCRVKCKHCGSVVIAVGAARLVANEAFDMPLVYQKRERRADDAFETESFSQWWTLDSMFAFENVGFTHSHNGRKYLACADCELGPIGLVEERDGTTRYLIARERTTEA